MEETKTRAATLLGKIFLQNLSTLSSLDDFLLIWLTILDFMKKFIDSSSSDLLFDAVNESIKNMLLVMNTSNLFNNDQKKLSLYWKKTVDKLNTFLPDLIKDLFGNFNELIQVKVLPNQRTTLG